MKTRIRNLAAFAALAAGAVFAPAAATAQDLLEAEILATHGGPPRGYLLESRGIEVELMENGQRFGYPVIFLHGFTDSWYSFARVMHRLPLEIRGYYYSQRGHGGSDKPACCYTQADYVADLLALMDQKGIEKATLVGHSMGSFIAHQFAVEHPDRVDALVLIGSSEKAGNAAVVEFDDLVQSLDEITPEFAREFQVSTLCGPIGDAFLDKVVGESLKVPLHVWKDALHELVLEDHSEQLGSLAIPTLVVGGMKDSLFPAEDQLALASRIPTADVALYAGVCHAPQWEDGPTFAQDLVQFLRYKVWS